jgi:starvation-inducible DNA-binding protein
VPARLSRPLAAHELIIGGVRGGIAATTANRVDGTNDLLMSDVLRRHELQVWFLAEHLVDTPTTRA